MRLVTPRSEISVDQDWTWLQPVAASTRMRHTLGTFVLAALILAGMATSTLLSPAAALPATAAVAGTAVALFVAIVRSAGSRLALSGLGLYLQNGGRARQVGWAAVRGVHVRRTRGRVRLVIDDGYRARATRATFQTDVARQWLALAAEEARRRRLDPQPDPDGLGFTTAAA